MSSSSISAIAQRTAFKSSRVNDLCRYGGVYLDMDMILSRPLPRVHNAVGSTIDEGGAVVLNGAFMAFDQSR